MMVNAWEIRNVAKQNISNTKFYSKMMFIVVLLIKKSLSLYNDIIDSLQNRKNIFNLKNFEDFIYSKYKD